MGKRFGMANMRQRRLNASHLLDNDANLQAGVAIALEAGVFLAAASR